MEPPPCVQNAMLKQTKKPFTYTPGGIDLSEIKSPRMQRRIERNANYEGVPTGCGPAAGVPTQPQNLGPLPPSALAAMQPQLQVQVFPAGPPPPPPPPSGRGGGPGGPRIGGGPQPPPPPPPALPTQKVMGSDNQMVERPDMTKIIPENPMGLLRKTGGPKPRKSLVDMMYENGGNSTVHTPPSPQSTQPIGFNNATIQPSVGSTNQQTFKSTQPRTPPTQPAYNPANQPFQPSVGAGYAQPSKPSQSVGYVQTNKPRTPPTTNLASASSSPGSGYGPTFQPSKPSQSPQPRTPPTTNFASGGNGNNYGSPVVNPSKPLQPSTTPVPWRQQSAPPAPQSPTLKEAPKPWQTKPSKPELPPWVKTDDFNNNINNGGGNKSRPSSIHIELKQPSDIVQPQIMVQPSKQFTRQISGGGNGSNPIQSNSFKIIQKLTNTDDNDDDNESIMVEPKYPKPFQGTNKPTPNEIDPRYRGSAIPSKAFKMLQSMTDGCGGVGVPNNENHMMVSPGQTINTTKNGSGRQPQIRNIPIQIERDDDKTTSKPSQPRYIHPSQQIVEEPKKYTGGSIPSRSFKILQAMTAPENCANTNEANDYYYYNNYYYYNIPPTPTPSTSTPTTTSTTPTPPSSYDYYAFNQWPYDYYDYDWSNYPPINLWDPYYYYYYYYGGGGGNGDGAVQPIETDNLESENCEKLATSQIATNEIIENSFGDNEKSIIDSDAKKSFKTTTTETIDECINNSDSSDDDDDDKSKSSDKHEIVMNKNISKSPITSTNETVETSTDSDDSDSDDGSSDNSENVPEQVINDEQEPHVLSVIYEEEEQISDNITSLKYETSDVSDDDDNNSDDNTITTIGNNINANDDKEKDWWSILQNSDDTSDNLNSTNIVYINNSDTSCIITDKPIENVEEKEDNPTTSLLSLPPSSSPPPPKQLITIKDRIKALKASISARQSNDSNRPQQLVIENECSDNGDGDDSGVTSDVSDNLSETRKIIRYQRTQTHSRLYHLLQTESDSDNSIELVINHSPLKANHLRLPFAASSNSSSGINSPGSPILSDSTIRSKTSDITTRKSLNLNDYNDYYESWLMANDGDSVNGSLQTKSLIKCPKI